MLTHDQLSTYVADRQQARMDTATAFRAGRLLRRARAALAARPTVSAPQAAPTPVRVPAASSPVVAHATGATVGTDGAPAMAVLRTAATAGAPEAA